MEVSDFPRLTQANGKDAEQLFSALDCRVATLKCAEENNPGSAMEHHGLPSADSSCSADGASLDEGSDAPFPKKSRLQDQGNLPDSSRSEESNSPSRTPVPECESSGEDKG